MEGLKNEWTETVSLAKCFKVLLSVMEVVLGLVILYHGVAAFLNFKALLIGGLLTVLGLYRLHFVYLYFRRRRQA
ncbi:MAG: hypothetical protein HYU64_08905 [Armatimonadetes bacterium]|nr:hypothetical protein [Armatimonadota bacterium]